MPARRFARDVSKHQDSPGWWLSDVIAAPRRRGDKGANKGALNLTSAGIESVRLKLRTVEVQTLNGRTLIFQPLSAVRQRSRFSRNVASSRWAHPLPSSSEYFAPRVPRYSREYIRSPVDTSRTVRERLLQFTARETNNWSGVDKWSFGAAVPCLSTAIHRWILTARRTVAVLARVINNLLQCSRR